MPLTKWSEKQAPLTIQEMDGNFEFLDQKADQVSQDVQQAQEDSVANSIVFAIALGG